MRHLDKCIVSEMWYVVVVTGHSVSPLLTSMLRKHGQLPVIELNGEGYGPLLTTRSDDDDDC